MFIKPFLLSDLFILARLITDAPSFLVINDADRRLIENMHANNVLILRNESQFVYRTEANPFLIFINLTNQPVVDPGFDAIIQCVHNDACNDYLFAQWHCLRNEDGSLYQLESHKKEIGMHASVLQNEISQHNSKSFWQFVLGKKQNTFKEESLFVYSREPLYVQKIIKTNAFIAKPNSKAGKNSLLIAAKNHSNEILYYKFPLSINSQKQILGELVTLETHATSIPEKIKIPSARLLNNHTSVVQLRYPMNSIDFQKSNYSAAHLQTLNQMYLHPAFWQAIEMGQWAYWPIIKKRLSRIEKLNNETPHLLISKAITSLHYLCNELYKMHTSIYTTIAHGATLSEIEYGKNGEVAIYSWEGCNLHMPVFYDYFNEIIQRASINQVTEVDDAYSLKIDAFFTEPVMADFIRKYAISTKLYFRMYMLCEVSAQIERFVQQPTANVNIAFWCNAIHQLVAGMQLKRASTQPISSIA